ncbi:MAG: squalene--hopene cyclase [Pseudomonadota bacterium]|nr:squalene--hopene cyclase [Pseudomonadota bacterium]
MRSVSIVLAVLFYSVCVSAEPDNAHYATDMGTEPDYSAPYAEYSADDPLGEFDIERAAQFVDGVAVKWGVKHDCVTCHTNGHYLMVPPKLFRHRPAAKDVLDFAEGWIDSWEEKGLPRTEIVVGPAAFLTINNMQMDGRLRPATRNALDEVWRLQSEEGHWEDWLKCEWPPFEQDDHYGVTLLTIAMGMAPESYTSVEPAQTGIRRMLDYLQRYAPEEVHHRAMMLWAGKYFDGLVSAGEREHWIDELLKLQKTSGGWASGDLGRWRQRAPETGGYSHLDPKLVEREYPPVMIDPNGDGYGTGFVLYVLLQAGVPVSHDQIQQGLAWLRQNQQADGKWFTNSLRNETDTSNFLTHTGTIFALMALAETM